MQKQASDNDFLDFPSLIAQLRQERGILQVKILPSRCGIQKQWEKAETKWQRLQATNDVLLDSTHQLAQELRKSYIRIYWALLAKSSKLLDRLNTIKQDMKPEGIVTLDGLERQVALEMASLRRRVEALGGTQKAELEEEEPACPCLKCKQEKGEQPLRLDQILAQAGHQHWFYMESGSRQKPSK